MTFRHVAFPRLPLFALPVLAACLIASPAGAMCVIAIDLSAGLVDADGYPRLYGCPKPVRHVTTDTSPAARALPQARAETLEKVPPVRRPAPPHAGRRSVRDTDIARALGQGYLGFRKVYRGQRYLGFEKVYSGPRYPGDLYDSGSRWSF